MFFWFGALVGHASLWITPLNRIEGTTWPRWLRYLATRCCVLCGLALPIVIAWRHGLGHTWPTSAIPSYEETWVVRLYFAICLALGVVPLVVGIFRRTRAGVSSEGTIQHQSWHTLPEELGPHKSLLPRVMLGLPGNEALRAEVAEKSLELPRLPEPLNGLTIAHVTDFHMAGIHGRDFYQRIVDLTNDMQADFVTITGDLVDRAEYIAWLPAILGRLQARVGVYAVLGNHDLKVDLHRVRAALSEAGVQYLGGQWRSVTVRDCRVVLAGNELPWILPAADMGDCPPRRANEDSLRILLAHSPDQLAWAKRFDFDLMLAGHTHGGQIRLPGLGPIFCPSVLPLDYAAGVFHQMPTTLHVSRGIAGEVPLRFRCRPELAKLVLRVAAEKEKGVGDVAASEKRSENDEPQDRRSPKYPLP